MAKISKTDFLFLPCGYGMVTVTYTSPTTRKEYTAKISASTDYIERVYQEPNPKVKDLEELKWRIKNKNLFE